MFLHDCLRHWKKGTTHREKFLLRVFRNAIMTYLKKACGISYFNKKQCPTASKIGDSVCYCIDHISVLYLPKSYPLPLCLPSCQTCPLFNIVLSPFRCGLFSPLPTNPCEKIRTAEPQINFGF